MDTIVRDKLRVFEAMYNVISESSEWAYNSGNDYMYFIEGVVAMTREQIKEIDERPNPMTCIEKEAAEFYNNYMNAKLEE